MSKGDHVRRWREHFERTCGPARDLSMRELVIDRFATRSAFFEVIRAAVGGRETTHSGYVHPSGFRIELQPTHPVGLWQLWHTTRAAEDFNGQVTRTGCPTFRRADMVVVCDEDLPAAAAWLVEVIGGVSDSFPGETVTVKGEVYSQAARRALSCAGGRGVRLRLTQNGVASP